MAEEGAPPAAAGPSWALSELEGLAGALSSASASAIAYANVAAGDTGAENVRAWSSYRLRPRMLRDVSNVSLATTLLDTPVASPIVIAPTAMHALFCEERELATARAAAGAGSLYVLSMAATTALEEVATAAPGGSRWMQMYVQRDKGWTKEICARAAAAGYRALVVTVDSPVAHSAPASTPERINANHPLPNLSAEIDDPPDVYDLVLGYDSSLTFDDLADLQAWAGGLPVVVKGILRGDDAVACVDAGAAAVCVSNHGGRQLDGSIATADALGDIVEAVDGRAEVYVDGGIRSGVDVLKALALGARAVLVGRPIIWGLAVNGERGVAAVLDQLQDQLRRAMALSGVVGPHDVPPDLVTIPAGSLRR